MSLRRQLTRAASRKRMIANDPYWSNVALLMHMDGANGSTTFTNAKTGATASVFGQAQISTAQSKFGSASALFDGNGDYISFPSAAGFNFGGGNFTIEGFVRFAGYPANNEGLYKSTLVAKDRSPQYGSPLREFGFNVTGTASSLTAIEFTGFASDTPTYASVSANFSFSLNTWYHVAVSRVGNLMYLFVDGVLLNPGGTAFNITIQTTSTTIKLGSIDYNDLYKYFLNGNLEEVRITKGVGRYSSSFTVPTAAYPEA